MTEEIPVTKVDALEVRDSFLPSERETRKKVRVSGRDGKRALKVAFQILEKIEEDMRRRKGGTTEYSSRLEGEGIRPSPKETRNGMASKKILMVAGETSGDLHGAHLMEAIHQIDPEVQFLGVGGEAFRAERDETPLPLPFPFCCGNHRGSSSNSERILKVLKGLKESLDREKPNLIILIDFPDFNLRLAKIAHQKGIPVLYYISPQIWAWRHGRVKLIAERVKKMVVFFPFEVPLYKAAGVDVEWVGHPLVDIVKPTLSKEEAFRKFGLDPQRRTIGLLPGSRTHEVERLLPPLLASAHLLQKEIPELQFVIPLAPGFLGSLIPLDEKQPSPVKLIQGWTYDVMNLSELLILASGTATLEGAILGKPMIIVYKVSSALLLGRQGNDSGEPYRPGQPGGRERDRSRTDPEGCQSRKDCRGGPSHPEGFSPSPKNGRIHEGSASAARQPWRRSTCSSHRYVHASRCRMTPTSLF